MGLFDFLKKKKEDKTAENSISEVGNDNSIYSKISKYNEYIALFIGMQQQSNYAPIAVYEKPDGEIIGFLYARGEDTSYDLAATKAVQKMKERFEKLLLEEKVLSYAILFHSPYDNVNNPSVATSNEQLKAIAVLYDFGNGEKGAIGLPYRFQEQDISYKGVAIFTEAENEAIFNTEIEEGNSANYFQDQEEIVAPSYENELGITIKKANTLGLHNIWGGVFGFEFYDTDKGRETAQEYFSLTVDSGVTMRQGNLSFFDLDYEAVTFRAIAIGEQLRTMLPIVQTDYSLDFETRQIQEWENIDNLEAIVSGRGRDTFGLWYFATDYAENKEVYQTQKNLEVNISGIVFVLDIHKPEEGEEASEGTPEFSENFTAYIPSSELPNYACFDFIGQLEDFKPTTLLEDGQINGYILNVRLITKEDQPDFFTIDLYVNTNNMRFETLEKGMKLTGMFQMQGCIVASKPKV